MISQENYTVEEYNTMQDSCVWQMNLASMSYINSDNIKITNAKLNIISTAQLKNGVKMFNIIKKKIIKNRDNDDILFEYVLDEMETGLIIKASWAKALAYSEGNHEKAESLYMQYRVQQIKDIFTKMHFQYNDLKREILFSKIKSLFDKSETDKTIEIKRSIYIDEDGDEIKKTYTKMDVFFNPKAYTEDEKKEILGNEYYES